MLDVAVLEALPPLAAGKHDDDDERVCAMEALARACGLGTTDSPECASDVIGAFTRRFNDSLPSDEDRDRYIRPLLPLMVGTAGDGHDEARAFLCADRAVRVFAPLALDAAGLKDEAARLRALAPVVDRHFGAACAARAADAAADNAAYAAYAARAARAADDAARAADAAAYDAADAAFAAAGAARAATAWQEAATLLRDLCLIGREGFAFEIPTVDGTVENP